MPKTGKKAIDLLKHFESLHDGDSSQIGLQPKMDPIGIWTEGYGHAMIDPATKQFLKGAGNKNKAAQLSIIKTEADATKILAIDLLVYENAVMSMIGEQVASKLTDDQFGALVSFAYNCGTKYQSSTGAKPYAIWGNVSKFVAGKMSAADLQNYWNSSVIKAGGKILPGLVRRRKSEAWLFINGSNKFQH